MRIKVVCPSGGWAGRWASCMLSFLDHCANKTIILTVMKIGTYLALMLLVVPSGGHIAIVYLVFHNYDKLIFFLPGPEFRKGCTNFHEN